MKICPTCKETYKDDDLNFCLSDGTTLIKKRTGVTTRHSRVNEIVAVILLAIAVLSFLSLISWSPTDWSRNSTGLGASHSTQNWIGVVGALISDFLFQSFGVIAYLFPALLALIAWRVFQSESLRPRISQLIGFTFFVASGAALVTMIGQHGGLLGALLQTPSVRLLGVVGASIFLVALAVTSILLISNFTLAWAFSHFEVGWGNFLIHFAEWKA
jgi:S-DNA-T family DNA segregation ATPase FtsK/SpoIIIE